MDTQNNIKDLIFDLKYLIDNPSAWTHFGQGVSDKIEKLVTIFEEFLDEKSSNLLRTTTCKILDLNPNEDDVCEIDSIIDQFAKLYHDEECKKCTKCHFSKPVKKEFESYQSIIDETHDRR